VFVPSGGYSARPFDTLRGREIVATQACETLGDQGDIILADLSAYTIVTKTAGLRAETSIHFYFDQDTTALKFVLRVGGQPSVSTALSPRDGSNTLSPFVTVAVRA
jgi:HK97 family phage major capsid protein